MHEPTGAVAALTELQVARPPRAYQDDTAVVPDHRGSGLGLWVKADMLRRLRAERPEFTEVITGNAASNAHMLRINDPARLPAVPGDAEWQGEVGELVSRLG